MMTLANGLLAGFPFSWSGAFIAAGYIYSMYVLNQLNDVESIRHNEPEKARFYERRKTPLTATALLWTVAAVGVSVVTGLLPFVAVMGVYFMGLGYAVKWFPTSELISIHRLKDVPMSKDFFVGVGWAAVTCGVPALIAEGDHITPGFFVASFFTFTLAYVRSVLADIRDIEGDKLVGRNTIPIRYGKEWTKRFLAAMWGAAVVALLFAYGFGRSGAFGLVSLLALGYTGGYLFLYHRRIINKGILFDLAVDGVFPFTGAVAIIWVLLT
jgi:4-hydroxy-3-methylbut-2-enyl diphosphate reductase